MKNCDRERGVKFLLILLLMFSLSATVSAQLVVNGRHLYTEAGEKVILRGVNEMFVWCPDKTGANAYPEIEKSGANAVRIAWNTSGSAQDLKACLSNCVMYGKAIPIVTLMDATGDWSKLPRCVDYWKRTDIKQVINELKKWVIINIANEAGKGDVSDKDYIKGYNNAITQLRDAGYTVPFIIDGGMWGQDFELVKRTWSVIKKSDKLNRTLFSVHPYWVDGGNAKFANMIKEVVSQNIPFLIGEGPEQVGSDCTSTIDYRYAIKIFQMNGIGWLTWSWGTIPNGNCKEDKKYDITTNGKYGNWANTWARNIVYADANSIKNTSKRPASILVSDPFAPSSKKP